MLREKGNGETMEVGLRGKMNGDADLFLLAGSGGVMKERWSRGCCLREKNSSRGCGCRIGGGGWLGRDEF
jgi:hypothetical protein